MRRYCLLFALSLSAFLTMGYHPGTEDDGVYLTAVKSDLDNNLYPHNAEFFRLEVRNTCFDEVLAALVRTTHVPLNWIALIGQFASIFTILAAALSIARQLFPEKIAHWASVGMLSCLLTLPVSGTGLYIVDQYLHPRAPATALILLAVSCLLRNKVWSTVPLLFTAVMIHPIMGLLGTFFCMTLGTTAIQPEHVKIPQFVRTNINFAAVPFGWLLDKPSGAWLTTLNSRHWYQPYHWTWYEWLGVIGPLVIFWLFYRHERKNNRSLLCRFTSAILIYALIMQSASMLIMAPKIPPGIGALEPMRYLHLIYIFLILVSGAYIGKYFLKVHVWCWAIFLLALSGGMVAAQRQLYPSTEHLELPGKHPMNQWVQAFSWIRMNTPQDAYFALDPNYLHIAGEDSHNFRALAERSALSDAIKDASVVTKVPELGTDWQAQILAETNWNGFRLAEFKRLKSEFGVDWVLISRSSITTGLDCRWHNDILKVCLIS